MMIYYPYEVSHHFLRIHRLIDYVKILIAFICFPGVPWHYYSLSGDLLATLIKYYLANW